MAPVSFHFSPYENFTIHAPRGRESSDTFPSRGYNFATCRIDVFFFSSFFLLFFTSESNVMRSCLVGARVSVHDISYAGVCALICAHFTIIGMRDRIVVVEAVSSLVPTLLLSGRCSSFVPDGTFGHVIRFSWSVPPERVTSLKVTAATPTPIRHVSLLLFLFFKCILVASVVFFLSSLPFPSPRFNWSERIVSSDVYRFRGAWKVGLGKRWRFKTINLLPTPLL